MTHGDHISRELIPLTRAQRGVWAAQRLFPTATAYRIGQLVWLDGAVDSAAFGHAVARAFEEADALRARFAEVDGTPWQWIDDSSSLVTEVVEEPADDAAIRHRVRASYDSPADPVGDALSSSTLFHREGGSWVWSFSSHHLLVDAYGLSLFTRRVAEIYTASLAGDDQPGRWFDEWSRVVDDENSAVADTGSPSIPNRWASMFDRSEPLGHAPATRGDDLFLISDRRVAVPLDPSAWSRLQDAARETKVTWAAYLTALWGTYMSLQEGRRELILRVPFMMRNSPAALRTPGMLVTTLPLVVDLDGESPIGDVAGEVGDQLRRTSREKDLTEEHVARRWPGGEFDYRALPHINIKAFDYQADFGGLVGRQETVNPGPIGRLDLTVYSDSVHGSRLELASHERFADADELIAQADRFAGFLEAALRRGPDVRVVDLPSVMTSQESAQTGSWSNGAELEVPDSTLDELVRARAATRPDGIAVIDDASGSELSFAAFDARVNALARLLVAQGVGVGDRVGVLLPRSSDLVVTLAGIIRAGAVWVPADTSYPADRVDYVFMDAGVSVVVTDRLTEAAHRSGLANLASSLVLLDDAHIADALARGAETAPTLSRRLSPNDEVYCVYTSGTTGRPKGVRVTHRGIVNRLAWAQAVHGFGPEDRVLQKTPATFDASLWEFFVPLLVGGAVVVAEEEGHKDPEYLADVIARQQVTVTHFVPSMLQAFLASEPDPGRLSSLRQVFVSGEAFPVSAALEARRVFGGARIDNVYGPTETTVDVTLLSLDVESLSPHLVVVPIGGPGPNVRAVVLDGWLRPVGPGVPGELYLGGVQLADGYVGRFALTAERFVADP
ncbi:AMP-binding protein, partial [Microbacterium sp. 18062]|uniref:AMP-binding protein n=1 Tax=Microbacterium sp. 18062 TaxID=2681410 RepID=UPI001356DCB7